MRKTFDQQLLHLSQELLHMGALCETAISSAADALKNRDVRLAERASEADQEIDQQEREIEQLCMKLLLQQQPVARDLRQISSALKMITDMERIGDQASDIAEIVRFLMGGDLLRDMEQIDAMAQATCRMVTLSVEAYAKGDLGLAKEVISSDDVVDSLFCQVKDQLIRMIARDPGCGEQALDYLMIAKYLERIGDHATNIAEWAEFSILGRHPGPDEALDAEGQKRPSGGKTEEIS